MKRRDGVERQPTEQHGRDRERKAEGIGPFSLIEKGKDRSDAEGDCREGDEHDQTDALVFETRPPRMSSGVARVASTAIKAR
jgi:hypothetical protein